MLGDPVRLTATFRICGLNASVSCDLTMTNRVSPGPQREPMKCVGGPMRLTATFRIRTLVARVQHVERSFTLQIFTVNLRRRLIGRKPLSRD